MRKKCKNYVLFFVILRDFIRQKAKIYDDLSKPKITKNDIKS